MGKFLPRYLKVSDQNFQQLLSNATPNGSKVIQCLDTREKLHCVRHLTEVTNNYYFKGLQQQLWQEYQTISSKDDHWEVKINKQYAHRHRTCRMYRPQKVFIEQRRRTTEHQRKQAANELQTYSRELQHNVTQWRPSIDYEVLLHTINTCVQNSQQRLRDDFHHRMEMIELDWTDHCMIAKFYELKPNEQVIELANMIWQTTDDELKTKDQLEILRQRIFLKRLPTKTDRLVNQLLEDQAISLSNPFLEKDQRASFVTRCSKTIIQCKFNLMTVQMDELETVIRYHHSKLLTLQEELSSSLKNSLSSLRIDSLVAAIEQRRKAMIDRLFRLRQYKLKTFFDEAPAMDNNDN